MLRKRIVTIRGKDKCVLQEVKNAIGRKERNGYQKSRDDKVVTEQNQAQSE